MRYALALMLLPSLAEAYVPGNVKSSDTLNQTLMEMSQVLNSQNLKNGGEIRSNLTVSSSVHVTGNATIDGFIYGDGSNITGLSAGVDVSSYTLVPETVVTDNIFTEAVTTVTLTVAAVPLQFVVAGSMKNNSAQESCWTVFVDGDHPVTLAGQLDEDTGLFCHVAAANACFNASAVIPIPALTAGSHDFALVPSTKAGTNLQFINGTTACSSSSHIRTIFGVREAH